MNRFEYLSVLISIIVGVGLSETISCWAHLLRQRGAVRFYWVHIGWTLLTLLMLVQFWWGFWQFSEVQGWTFRGLLAVVALGVTMVMAMLVITPPRERDVLRRLDDFYWAQAPLYFFLGGLVMLLLILVDWLVGEQPLFHPENAVRIPAALLLFFLARSRAQRLHAAVLVTSYGLFALFIAVVYVRT
jgi:hypothetical protein